MSKKITSPVLEALARRYERSQAGRTGLAGRDFLILLEELLAAAGCREGEKRAVAERELLEAERAGLLKRDPVHRRDQANIHQIRFSPANEAAFFAMLDQPSPTQMRAALAAQFEAAASFDAPLQWRGAWCRWCGKMREAALTGRSVAPFDRMASEDNSSLLRLLPRLLAWEGESLVRFASCVLCADSKRLEAHAPIERDGEFSGQLRGKLGRLLEDITGGQIRALDELGIVPNPRSVLAHGPLRLRLDGVWFDCSRLRGSYRLSQEDIERAAEAETTAQRCLTVENETSFQELAKLQSGELLVQTSYPGSGTVALLRRLPVHLEFWHFGDSDAAGFDILRVLREKTKRDFRPLHMQVGRVPFEQEAMGRPTRNHWPFYE